MWPAGVAEVKTLLGLGLAWENLDAVVVPMMVVAIANV